MANFCKNCGSKLNPGARFCEKCGKKIFNENEFFDINAYVPNSGNNIPHGQQTKERWKDGKKRGIGILNPVLAGIMIIEILLLFFWHPGLLRMKKRGAIVTGSMSANTLSIDDFSISFGEDETGKAALLDDILEIESPNASGGKVYDLAVSNWPSGPVTVAMDAPAPGEDEGYLVRVGIPAADASGNETVVWCPVNAEWSDGKVVVELDLTDVAGNVENISFYSLTDYGGELWDRSKEYGQKIISLSPSVTFDAISDYTGDICSVFISEPELNSDCLSAHFYVHVPSEEYDSTNRFKSKIRKSDIENYLEDLEGIYDYYAANYDVSPRTRWPMDVYIGKFSGAAACFAMPARSLGGRIGTKPIDESYMKINIDYIINYGYKRTAPSYAKDEVELYSSSAHELFHFVQRCYVSKGGTELWFDESSAAYYDSLFSQKMGMLILDENYRSFWFQQFNVLPTSIYERSGNPTEGWPLMGDVYEYVVGSHSVVYARMPVFCYLMQKNSKCLGNAYEYLRKNKGYNDDVLSYSASTVMAPLVRGYFRELVTLGTLYAKYNTPWEIYDGCIDGDKNKAKVDKAAWNALRYNETLSGSEQNGKYDLSPYCARFVILDTSKLPDKEASLKVALTTPAINGTLYKIEGNSYDKVAYSEIPSQKETSMTVKKGDKLLLMLVNERNSNCYGKVTYSLENSDITSFLGQWSSILYDYEGKPDADWRITIKKDSVDLPGQYKNNPIRSYVVEGNKLTLYCGNNNRKISVALSDRDNMTVVEDDSPISYIHGLEFTRVPSGQESDKSIIDLK